MIIYQILSYTPPFLGLPLSVLICAVGVLLCGLRFRASSSRLSLALFVLLTGILFVLTVLFSDTVWAGALLLIVAIPLLPGRKEDRV